eukprot:COSAG01_NODE_51915_length_350_cov_59.884462_1_plen_107_part_01
MHPPWEMTIDRPRSSTFLTYMLLHEVGEDYWSNLFLITQNLAHVCDDYLSPGGHNTPRPEVTSSSYCNHRVMRRRGRRGLRSSVIYDSAHHRFLFGSKSSHVESRVS